MYKVGNWIKIVNVPDEYEIMKGYVTQITRIDSGSFPIWIKHLYPLFNGDFQINAFEIRFSPATQVKINV